MAFKKGMSGNPSGRPPGAKDKKSEKLREWLLGVVDKNRQSFAEDLAAVDPATRWNIIAKILPYVLPRLNAVELKQGGGYDHAVFIVHQSSDITPASSEEEVLAREKWPPNHITEEEFKEYQQMDDPNALFIKEVDCECSNDREDKARTLEERPVFTMTEQETSHTIDKSAAKDEERRAHEQLIHQQRKQQRKRSGIVRQY